MARSVALKKRFPIWTLSICSASVITYAVPQLTGIFIYDRHYVLDGQLWRLLTASFVHFSASHLIWNLLVLAAAGCVIEFSGYRRFGLMCVLAIVVPTLLFLAIKPDMIRYGGLSAPATGAVAYLCLGRAQQTCRDKGLWMTILCLLLVKICAEGVIDAPIFAKPAGLPFRVLPSAHLIGVAAAVVALVSDRRNFPKDIDVRRSADDIHPCMKDDMPNNPLHTAGTLGKRRLKNALFQG